MSTRPNLDGNLRLKLINTLCGFPPLTTRDGRDVWLMSLPPEVRGLITRRHDHCKTDLALIIDAIQPLQFKDGRWPLLILLDALLTEADPLMIGNKLAELRQEVHSLLDPPTGLDCEPEFEEIIIGEDEKVTISFLNAALTASKAVSRISVERTIGGRAFGTGWLIAPGLVLTNHHVIKARKQFEGDVTPQEFKQQAESAVLWFGYDSRDGYSEYQSTALIQASEMLDYALLRISDKSADGIPLSQWGFLNIAKSKSKLDRGARLNVIQHPGGRVKEIALRTNFYIGSSPEKSRLHYLSDTEGGSSGSPVLDDKWQVIALHHAWAYYSDHYKDRPIRFNSLGLQYDQPSKFANQSVAAVNEGIEIHAILDDLHLLGQEISRAQGWI